MPKVRITNHGIAWSVTYDDKPPTLISTALPSTAGAVVQLKGFFYLWTLMCAEGTQKEEVLADELAGTNLTASERPDKQRLDAVQHMLNEGTIAVRGTERCDDRLLIEKDIKEYKTWLANVEAKIKAEEKAGHSAIAENLKKKKAEIKKLLRRAKNPLEGLSRDIRKAIGRAISKLSHRAPEVGAKLKEHRTRDGRYEGVCLRNCRVGGGATMRWPPSAAQTVRAVFPHTAFTKTRSAERPETVSAEPGSPARTPRIA